MEAEISEEEYELDQEELETEKEETTEQYIKRIENEAKRGYVQQHVHKNVDEFPDSITIGTPGRGGEIKIYFNALDVSAAEEKLIQAFKIRKIAQEQLSLQEPIIK
jgi:hypothetical protein